MDTRCQAHGESVQTSCFRRLAWVALLSLSVSGCITGLPWKVQIQRGSAAPPGKGDAKEPARLMVTTFNVWGLPSWVNGASTDRYRKIANE